MSMYYDLLNESLKEKEIETVDLDEDMGKVATATGILTALTGLAANYNNHHHNASVKPDSEVVDYLKVPEYKDMPNLWDDTENVKPQKVSISNSTAETTDKQPETKKTQSNVANTILNTVDTFKDAYGKTWDLTPAYDYLMKKEKFRSHAYKDGKTVIDGKTVTRYSIGYGTLSPNNDPNATITEPEARKAKCEHIAKEVLPRFFKNRAKFETQGQFSAMVCFTYNTGKICLKKDKTGDINRMQKYKYIGKKKNAGLEERRRDEVAMFFSED